MSDLAIPMGVEFPIILFIYLLYHAEGALPLSSGRERVLSLRQPSVFGGALKEPCPLLTWSSTTNRFNPHPNKWIRFLQEAESLSVTEITATR